MAMLIITLEMLTQTASVDYTKMRWGFKTLACQRGVVQCFCWVLKFFGNFAIF